VQILQDKVNHLENITVNKEYFFDVFHESHERMIKESNDI